MRPGTACRQHRGGPAPEAVEQLAPRDVPTRLRSRPDTAKPPCPRRRAHGPHPRALAAAEAAGRGAGAGHGWVWPASVDAAPRWVSRAAAPPATHHWRPPSGSAIRRAMHRARHHRPYVLPLPRSPMHVVDRTCRLADCRSGSGSFVRAVAVTGWPAHWLYYTASAHRRRKWPSSRPLVVLVHDMTLCFAAPSTPDGDGPYVRVASPPIPCMLAGTRSPHGSPRLGPVSRRGNLQERIRVPTRTVQ